MMVMTDLEEPFVPLSEGLFVDPYESKSVITSLLNRIPSIFSHVKNPEPVVLPTLNAALSALQATGGKVVCALSSLPTWGPGKLENREDPKIHGTEAERKLFTTENPEWKKTASKMAEAGVGVDLFIAAPGGVYLDVATIGMLKHNQDRKSTNSIYKAMYRRLLAARHSSIRTSMRLVISQSCGESSLTSSAERRDTNV